MNAIGFMNPAIGVGRFGGNDWSVATPTAHKKKKKLQFLKMLAIFRWSRENQAW
jgi:hypothetical protein